MAAKAWGAPQPQSTGESSGRPGIDEVFFQNDLVSLCLLINRRARIMRVVDFRAGPSDAKRMFVVSLAKREGMEKVYTLVERDEVSTWVKLGFAKEGNIPGFYKRSDAFMLGMNVRAQSDVPGQSEMRLAAVRAAAEDDDAQSAAMTAAQQRAEAELDPAHILAEKTLIHAKKHAKDLAERPLPATKIAALKEGDAQKAVTAALRAGKAYTAFEPFGRGVQRSYFTVGARSGFELVVSVEAQACFGNAFLEMLTVPSTEADRLGTVSALRSMCDKLKDDGVVSCFGLSPSDHVELATAFVFNGFRRTGLLKAHLVTGIGGNGPRRDAIIWSRKLSNPEGE